MSRLRRKASIFTKLAVLVVVAYAAFNLIGLHGQIESAKEARTALYEAVAEQTLENAVLESELATSRNPETIERIARNRFGLVLPGERTFYGATN